MDWTLLLLRCVVRRNLRRRTITRDFTLQVRVKGECDFVIVGVQVCERARAEVVETPYHSC